jgi:large subunit ribosomal protein L25
MITLQAKQRDTKNTSAQDVRKGDSVPCVLYGYKVDNQNIECDYQEFHKAFVKAGESTIIDLKIGDKTVPVLIHQMDLDPVTNKYSHVDFFVPNMSKEVTANIAIEIIGEAPGVKEHGGILIRNKDTLGVKCLPKDLPHNVEVDISTLENLHDSVTVADIKLSSAVTITDNAEDIIVSVQPPRKEEEETPVETAEGETAEGETPAEGEDAKKEGEPEKKEEEKK